MKQILILAILAITFASCNQDTFTDVTVTKKHNDFRNGALNTMTGVKLPEYEATTPSGAKIVVIVDEAIALSKKLPYTARMRKNSMKGFGFIEIEHQSGDFLPKP